MRSASAVAGAVHPVEEEIGAPALGVDSLFAAGRPGPPLPVLRELGNLVVAISRAPAVPVQRGRRWVSDLVSIARGRSPQDSARDRRYADSAWHGNPLLRALAQSHGATERSLVALLDELPLPDRDRQRLRLVLDNVLAATSPANAPLLNPSALKAAVDQGAANYVRGTRSLLGDVIGGRRVPPNTAPDAFRIGEDVAATPGSVVLRTPVLELIHYRPTTERVHDSPVLIAPSVINKYYIVDLTHDRSIVGHLLEQGYEVFAASYVNPHLDERHLGLDAYVESVVAALDAVRSITGAAQTHLCGICMGGTIMSVVAGWLAGEGRQDQIASVSIPLSVMAPREFGLTGSLLDERAVDNAIGRAARRGFVDGREIGESFAWLRPVEGVWMQVIHRYLLGGDPVPNELLSWVADQVNVTSALQRDLRPVILESALFHPDALTVLGRPIDLSRVEVPTYGVGGTDDYLSPWQGCLRSLTAMSGPARFVLASGGHLSALLAAPGPRARPFHVGPANGGVTEWQDAAELQDGSWWTDWTTWLAKSSSGQRRAPEALGSAAYPPVERAPGSYVRRSFT